MDQSELNNEFEEKLSMLRPLTGKPKNKIPIAAFDVETEHARNDLLRSNGKLTPSWEQRFVLGAVVWDGNEQVFRDRDEMGDFLVSREMRDHFILATNLEFDMGILYPNIHERFKLIYRHNLKGAFYLENRTEHKNGTTYNRDRKWMFGDTKNYLPFSVAELGKIVNLPKLPHPSVMQHSDETGDLIARRPETNQEWNELATYCINDARISYLFGNLFRQFCTDHNMKMKLTLSSCGVDFWRRNYQTEVMVREPARLLDKHFLGSFRGGMTIMYKRGSVPDKLYSYDINSAYPYAMVQGIDGKGSYPNPSSFQHREQITLSHIEQYEGITDCTVTMPYMYAPPLGVKENNGRLVFPVGTFRGWFTNIELRTALECGAELQPHEGIFYERLFVPFAHAAKVLYDLRMKYGKGHHYYQMVKTLLNAGLFGRWGMNYKKMEDITSSDSLLFDTDGKAYMMDGDKKRLVDKYLLRTMAGYSNVCIINKIGRPQRTSFPILSEYTTAICRLHLWSLVKNYTDYLAYTDTDSAFMTKRVWESDEKTLGAMKIEKEASDSMIVALKLYRTDDKCKSKGVGKFMDTREQFDRAIQSGNVQTKQWLRFKSAWAHQRSPGTMLQVQKHLKLDDTKRNWNGKKFNSSEWQDSKPLIYGGII